MIARPTAALALLTLLASPSAADEPKAFTCTFVNGVTHSYDNGAFVAEKPSPLAFGIAAIDARAQTAELKTRGRGISLPFLQVVFYWGVAHHHVLPQEQGERGV